METHLDLLNVAKAIWQTLLISGHFIVPHSDLMLAFCIFTYNGIKESLKVVVMVLFF
jgi:hypothetical protein